MKKIHYLRIIGAILFGLISFYIMLMSVESGPIRSLSPLLNRIIISVIAAAFGFLIFPSITIKPYEKIGKASITHIILVIWGLIVGLIAGALISSPMSRLPGVLGIYGPMLCVFLFCGFSVAVNLQRIDEFSILANRLTNGKLLASEIVGSREKKILLDTSVIIDGRIADIARTGFLPGTLIIPRFILQELQYIADSEDSLRRQRGRRGLEILASLQKEDNVIVKIENFEVENVKEVDSKLVVLAKQLNCQILTNDYNLNKVADLQGISILNVNDLANAVKSVLLPGEALVINVIQEGKEQNQGVGYMEDGTMVVVENGRCYLNHEVSVVVTKVLQTAAGRMIFAKHEDEIGVKR